jgi:AraC-like DNA-binding protein
MKAQVIQYLKSCDLARARVELFGDDLGMSVTTVERRLSSQGTGWLRLKIAERQRRCDEILEAVPNASASTLASVCGYSQRADFCRAFRGWHGAGLNQYRGAL